MNLFAFAGIKTPAPTAAGTARCRCHVQATKRSAEEGRRRRDNAIQRVAKNAPADFLEPALQTVQALARMGREFTTDDVWEALADDFRPREPRAMGAVMRQAQKLGLIVPLPQYRPSIRPECHRNPKRVWAAPSIAQKEAA